MRLFKILIILLTTTLIGYSQSGKTIKGKVLETMNGGGYTYLLLETSKDKIWVATMEIPAEKGQTIELQSGMIMENFESKSLNRVFDKIIFSAGLPSTGSKASGHDHGSHSMSKPAAAKDDPIAALSRGTWKKSDENASTDSSSEVVTKAEGANSYTIEEIYKSGEKLNMKPVRVKGKVVKALAEIMGKNWIHLQDGTGIETNGTHDLVVTSQDLPVVGQIVTMMGTLYTNKDFGSGYSYKIILEEASIMK